MKDYISTQVLLIEDNDFDAELTLRALRSQGFVNDIHHIKDGEEALDFVFCRGQYEKRKDANPMRLILLDLKLPKIHGLDILKEIKSNPKTAKIPVVILTSSKEDPDIEKAYDYGANSYVVKPVDFDDFMKALQNTGLFWLLVNQLPE